MSTGTPQANNNSFFGIRFSLPGINVNNASPSQLLYENNYSTTTWRDNNGTIQLQEGNLGNSDYGLSAGGGNVVLDSTGLKYSDSSNIRAFMGKNTTLGDGFYVSKTGYDANTASASNLIFNSNQDVFKIVSKITTNIPSFSLSYDSTGNITSGNSLLTIAHNLSFTPIIMVYVKGSLFSFAGGLITSSYVPTPIYVGNQGYITQNYQFPTSSGSYANGISILNGVDSTNVYINATYENSGNNTSLGTVDAIPTTIFLLQETAS